MRTILIAHKNFDVATELAAEFRQSGFRVIECPGPLPPKERCIRCDKGYCPLTEGADLMVYDPQLTAVDPQGRRYNLALDSARAHPEIPLLLAWAPDEVPDAGTLRAVRFETPNVHVAASTPAGRSRQVRQLIAASQAPEVVP
jgi:hypothetical protein